MPRISTYYTYIALSNVIVAAFVVDALLTFEQFYPAVVFLTSSRVFGIMMHNAIAANVLLCSSALRKIFFGSLSPVERQRMNEEFFVQLFESCIGLVYFQGVLTSMLTIAFVLTGACKMFHLLATARLESIQRSVQRPTGAIRRLSIFLVGAMCLDVYFMLSCASHVFERGVNVYLMLLLSFSVMSLSALVTQIKLLLHLRDDGNAAPSPALFYVDTFSTIADGILYISFFAAMTRVATPLHLVRDLLRSIKNIVVTLRAALRYRRLAANIDKVFEPASEEDIERDRRCAVCYDDMLPDGTCKKLKCGHCYHRDCLRKWLEANSKCPYCRKEIDSKPTIVEPTAAELAARRAAARPAQVPRGTPPPPATPLAAHEPGDGGELQRERVAADDEEEVIHAAYEEYLKLHAQMSSAAAPQSSNDVGGSPLMQTTTTSPPSSAPSTAPTVEYLQAQLAAFKEYKCTVESATRRLEAKLLVLEVQNAAMQRKSD